MLTLTVAQRVELKARAHALNPVVIVGDAGLTPAVINEVDRSLKSHDLLKIRVAGAERADREAMMQTLCETLGCAPVQHIGKILVVYRPLPETPAETRRRKKATKPLTKRQLGERH